MQPHRTVIWPPKHANSSESPGHPLKRLSATCLPSPGVPVPLLGGQVLKNAMQPTSPSPKCILHVLATLSLTTPSSLATKRDDVDYLTGMQVCCWSVASSCFAGNMSSFPPNDVKPCFYAVKTRYYPSYHSIGVLSSFIKECAPLASVYIEGVDSLRSVLATQLRHNGIKIRQKSNPTSFILLMTEHTKNFGNPYIGPIQDALKKADGRPVFMFTPLESAIYYLPHTDLPFDDMTILSTQSKVILVSDRGPNRVSEELCTALESFVWVAFNVRAPMHFDRCRPEAMRSDTAMRRFYNEITHIESVTDMQHGRNPSCVVPRIH